MRPAAPPRRRRTWLWVLIGLLLIGAVVWFLTHSGAGQDASQGGSARHGRKGGGMMNAPTTVSVAAAKRGDVPIYLNELGAVTPLATVTIQSQISGYLQQIAFKEGQMVAKGQFLAQIDPRPYQAALLQAQGAIARDQATLAEARLDLVRYQTLLAQDSIARQQVDVQAATVKQDEGTVKVDEAAVATAKLNLAYTHITSPVAGRVGLRQVDIGTYVTSGLTNGLVVVTQLAPIDVEFTLPEDNLPQVIARTHTGASLPVTAYDRTGATELAQGALLTLDNVIDPSTGTVKAKARFDNGAGTLFPQQFVNVRILVDTLRNAITAPTSAVLRGPSGLFVYVVQGSTNNHSVTVRQVKTGAAANDLTAITDGLQPGEMVVTDGTDRLREGAKVILPGDCIPAFAGLGGAGGAGAHRHRGGGGAGGHGGGRCAGGGQQAGRPGAAGIAQNPNGAGGNATGGAAAGDQAPGGQTAAPAAPAPRQGQGGRMQAMLSQLNLDPQQQLKAQALFTAARGQVESSTDADADDPDARRNAMRQAYGKAFDQLNAILRPEQKVKLAQLRAQMAQHQGPGGGGHGGGGQGGGDQ